MKQAILILPRPNDSDPEVHIKLKIDLNVGRQSGIFRFIESNFKSDIFLEGFRLVGIFKERRGRSASQSWGAVHHSHPWVTGGHEEADAGVAAVPASR